MSAENLHSVTVGIEADTPVEFIRGADSYPEAGMRAGFDRVNVGGATIWPGYLANDDADVVTACDHLIDALQQVRAHALRRLSSDPAATLAADPDLLFVGTVGEFLAAQEGGEAV